MVTVAPASAALFVTCVASSALAVMFVVMSILYVPTSTQGLHSQNVAFATCSTYWVVACISNATACTAEPIALTLLAVAVISTVISRQVSDPASARTDRLTPPVRLGRAALLTASSSELRVRTASDESRRRVDPDGGIAGGVDDGGMDSTEVLADGHGSGEWGGAGGVDGGGMDGTEVLTNSNNGNGAKGGGGGGERTTEEGTLLMTTVIVVTDSTWLSSSAVELRI